MLRLSTLAFVAALACIDIAVTVIAAGLGLPRPVLFAAAANVLIGIGDCVWTDIQMRRLG